MNKKVALVTLIESSFLLSSEDKLALIDRVPSFTERQVDTVGKFLALERQIILAHKQDLTDRFESMLSELEQGETNRVYIGSGKPS